MWAMEELVSLMFVPDCGVYIASRTTFLTTLPVSLRRSSVTTLFWDEE